MKIKKVRNGFFSFVYPLLFFLPFAPEHSPCFLKEKKIAQLNAKLPVGTCRLIE